MRAVSVKFFELINQTLQKRLKKSERWHGISSFFKKINMKQQIVLFLLLLVVLGLVCALAVAEEDKKEPKKPGKKDDCKKCAKDEGCCYDYNNNHGKATCYSKKTHQCNGGHRLCPKGLHSCGKACYDSKEYFCYNHHLIPISKNRCHEERCDKLKCCPTEKGRNCCYNPNHQKCTPKGLVWKCYDYWGNDKDSCSGHGECYGLDDCRCEYGYTGKRCQHHNLICRCQKDEKCCHGKCYDSKTHECHHGKHICPKDKKYCGDHCYDEKSHHCYKGKYLCRKGEKLCGKVCYDSKKSECKKGHVEDKKDYHDKQYEDL